jgi:hypothetical protein
MENELCVGDSDMANDVTSLALRTRCTKARTKKYLRGPSHAECNSDSLNRIVAFIAEISQ